MDIFIKRERVANCIKKSDLSRIVPENSLDREDIELQKIRTEWRWRIYEINGKTYTETSIMEPGENRKYLDKYGKWIEKDGLEEYDKYIIKNYYYYTN